MKFLKRLIIIVILAIITIGLIVGIPGYRMYKGAIEETSVEQKVEEIKKEKNNYTEFADLPELYVNAVVATEDHRFYNHQGFDVISIARAVFNDVKEQEFVEGGSTITQQLAKNIYFSQERTSRRKIAEILMAIELEKKLSKNEILELYVNTSYFGDGYYTVKDACKGYFNKELEEMTDYECIVLAGIPNAPSIYAPTKNPELTKQRARQVIKKMVTNEYLSQEEADKIIADGEKSFKYK